MDDTGDRSISSIESLGDLDWDGLLEVCKEKEEQLNLAGACGLKLHEQLMDTQAHIDDMRAQHDSEIERLVQETFELKSKLESKEKALLSQVDDFEEFQIRSSKKHERDIEEMQENVKKELRIMKKQKDSTMAEFEQAQIREQQAIEKVSLLEKRVQELQIECMKKVKLDTNHDELELMKSKEKILLLEELNAEHNEKLCELQTINQTLSLELSTKTKQTSELGKELEEVEMRCTTYFNHLQQAREEKTEIKTELDLLKAQTRNSGHKQSGNSLFSEVEDKRVEMEKKLLSMQVKYESLLKAYNFVKNQLHNMKTQVYALLQVKNARADEDHISRLERALSQAKSENAVLTNKMKITKGNQDISKEDIATLASLPEFKKSQDLVDFLYGKIEDYRRKAEKLQKDYDQIYMVKIAESDKLHIAEQRLYESTVQSDAYNQANMRLRLKLEEIKNKLEAETQKRKLVEKKFDYDSSTDVVPIGVINDQKKMERKPLPYTLTKAKEKAEAKIKQTNSTRKVDTQAKVSFASGMEWHKLPKEILDQLGIKLSENVSNEQENIIPSNNQSTINCNISNTPTVENSSPDPDRPRRVSFKETPETIPVKDFITDDVIDENPLTSTMIDDVIVPYTDVEDESKVDTPLSSKKLSKSPLQDATNTVPNKIEHVINKPLTSDDTEDGDCKVQ